jgi:hypothetical protein
VANEDAPACGESDEPTARPHPAGSALTLISASKSHRLIAFRMPYLLFIIEVELFYPLCVSDMILHTYGALVGTTPPRGDEFPC